MSDGHVLARTALTALCVKLGEAEVARGLAVSVTEVLTWADDISGIPAQALLRLEELTYFHTALSDLGYPDTDIRRWFTEATLASGAPLDLVARGTYSDAEVLRTAIARAKKRAAATLPV